MSCLQFETLPLNHANKPHSKNNDFVNVVWNRLLTQLGNDKVQLDNICEKGCRIYSVLKIARNLLN